MLSNKENNRSYNFSNDQESLGICDISNFEIGVFHSPDTKKTARKIFSSEMNSDKRRSSSGAMSLECSVESSNCDQSRKDLNGPSSDNTRHTKSSALDNPVYRQLSKINGEINRMHHSEIRTKLRELRLDSRGKKDVIKKRLKTYYKKNKLDTLNLRDPNSIKYYYEKFIVVDFEATCEDRQSKNFRQEIIEFPAVLICSKSRQILSEFHTYVRPLINPRLSEFCTSLTGIQQEDVNFAPMFPEVIEKFEDWLTENMPEEDRNFALVTDGPWDMGRFMLHQCSISDIPFPLWAKKWINVRKSYSNFYSTKRVCLQDMLTRLGLKFEGRPHCGIDDARNIARITQMLLRDGANLRVNERIQISKSGLMNPRERRVHNVSRKEFEEMKSYKSTVYSTNEHEDKIDDEMSENEDDLVAVTDEYLQSLEMEDRVREITCINLNSCEEFPDLGSRLRISSS